jgi:hypothetical protein
VSRAEYDLARYYRRRQQAIEYLGGQCVDCGTEELLEFDHIDPATKEFSIASSLLHGDVKLYRELAKCVLRCTSCHKQRTAQQQSVDHGGGLSGKKNCKCIPCKARKAEYMRSWKRKPR